MTYFTRPSSEHDIGGRKGETEVIYGREQPWLMENIAIAICKDSRMAEHIAKLLCKYPFRPEKLSNEAQP